MDPIAHTFTGAALAAAGLRRATPLATATLLLAVNAPDVDIVVQFAGTTASLAHRRGWTHGVAALLVWPFVLLALMLAWDRWVRRRRDATAAPARPRALLALAALGVATHPALDWLNTYGMRWLMPFDGRWSYGDAVFIVDPWLWLLLGGALFLLRSERWPAMLAWAAFFGLASWLIASSGLAPVPAQVLWFAGLVVLLALRVVRGLGTSAIVRANVGGAPRGERLARGALAAAAAYIAAMIGLNLAVAAEVRRELAAAGEPAVALMAAPLPANPFRRAVVARVDGGYRLGDHALLRRPRLRLEPEPLDAGPNDGITAAAAQDPAARDFLTWVRFPLTRVHERDGGYDVVFGDARAAVGQGPMAAVTVHVARGAAGP